MKKKKIAQQQAQAAAAAAAASKTTGGVGAGGGSTENATTADVLGLDGDHPHHGVGGVGGDGGGHHPVGHSKAMLGLKKNFASLDCGAKVVSANPESQGAGNIISPAR